MDIIKTLFENKDDEYAVFQRKLCPSVEEDRIIGVRVPKLRIIAKSFAENAASVSFLDALPHHYYEEYLIHGFLIERIKDFDICVARLDDFLPFVDNWAVCDCTSPKVLGGHKDKLVSVIMKWIHSDKTYVVRYAIKLLMQHYLDDAFDEKYLGLVAGLKSEEYYVKMMQAFYFATALAKQYDSAIGYIEKGLDPAVRKMAVRKARESFRISDERKKYLSTLK